MILSTSLFHPLTPQPLTTTQSLSTIFGEEKKPSTFTHFFTINTKKKTTNLFYSIEMATLYISFKVGEDTESHLHDYITTNAERISEELDDEGYYVGYAKMKGYYHYKTMLNKDKDDNQRVDYCPKNVVMAQLDRKTDAQIDEDIQKHRVVNKFYELIINALTPEQIKELKHKL